MSGFTTTEGYETSTQPGETTTNSNQETTQQQTTGSSGQETTTDRQQTTTDSVQETTTLLPDTTTENNREETTNQQTTESTEVTTTDSNTDETTSSAITSEQPGSSGNSSCPPVGEGQAHFVCPTGFRRHPKDCGMFYQCTESPETSHLSIVSFNCPNGTIYDEDAIQCRDRTANDNCASTSQNSSLLRGTLFDIAAESSPIVS